MEIYGVKVEVLYRETVGDFDNGNAVQVVLYDFVCRGDHFGFPCPEHKQLFTDVMVDGEEVIHARDLLSPYMKSSDAIRMAITKFDGLKSHHPVLGFTGEKGEV